VSTHREETNRELCAILCVAAGIACMPSTSGNDRIKTSICTLHLSLSPSLPPPYLPT